MRLLFATANQNKYDEVKAMLPKEFTLLSLHDVSFQKEIPETRQTIEGNASQKVEFIMDELDINCFADDTGLEVEALNGAPGVYSARFAGPEKDANKNMDKLLLLLKTEANKNAQFKTVIALMIHESIHLFTGILKGKITNQKRGENGFGYDPIFIPEGYDRTLAELSKEEKNEISHRAIAFRQLIQFLRDYP